MVAESGLLLHHDNNDRTGAAAATTTSCCLKPFAFVTGVFNNNHSNNNNNNNNNNIEINARTQLLNSLSQEERKNIMEDIHGVYDDNKKDIESSEYINQHLELLSESINRIKKGSRERYAYDIAMKLNPTYVTNKKFLLKFLRCDEYNIKNTTKRIMLHFKCKLELFGKDKLVSDIMFNDLSTDVQQLVTTGVYQILKEKDIQGRTILAVCPEFHIPSSWENFARARWYQIMAALEDEETQKSGFVSIIFKNEKSVIYKSNLQAMRWIECALPQRYICVHACFINATKKVSLSSASLIFTKWCEVFCERTQLRFRLHIEDSAMHCLYNLQSFGIDPKSLPIESNGRTHKKLFYEELEKRKMFEQQIKNDNVTITKITEAVKSCHTAILSTTPIMTTSCNTTTTTNNNNNNKNGPTAISNSSADESSSSSPSTVSQDNSIIPTDKDVILRQGVKWSLGNVTLDTLIDSQIVLYQKAHTKFEKTCIVMGTVKTINESGGRFLKKKKNKWFIADNDKAHKGVSERFRVKVLQIEEQQQQQQHNNNNHHHQYQQYNNNNNQLRQQKRIIFKKFIKGKQQQQNVLHCNHNNYHQRQYQF